MTRSAALTSQDGSVRATVHLGKKGKDFEFSQLSMQVEFVECSARGSNENDDAEIEALEKCLAKLWTVTGGCGERSTESLSHAFELEVSYYMTFKSVLRSLFPTEPRERLFTSLSLVRTRIQNIRALAYLFGLHKPSWRF